MASADAVLVLDTGEQLPVHSCFLQHKSTVLAEAVRLAQQSRNQDGKTTVPLPSTSEEEARLLIALVYAHHPDWYLADLDRDDFWPLIRACHRFGFDNLLKALDEYMSSEVSYEARMSWKADALKALDQAHTFGMPKVAMKAGEHIYANAKSLVRPGLPSGSLGTLVTVMAQRNR